MKLAGVRRSAKLIASVTVIAGLCGAAACSDAGATRIALHGRPLSLSPSAPEKVRWSVITRIGGELNDTLLQMVVGPAVGADGVYVSDLAAKRVTKFDHSGNTVWQFGRPGGGPGEFSEPRDVRLDTRGNVWVLDPKNARITILTSAGSWTRDIPLTGIKAFPLEMVPQRDGTVILYVLDPNAPFVRLDSLGNVIERVAPWSDFAALPTISSQLTLATDPTDEHWIAGFRVGPGFFRFEDKLSRSTIGHYSEKIPFPKVVTSREGNRTISGFEEKPISAARSITLSHDHIYVLFGGTSNNRRKLVDVYDTTSLEYVRSFLLPESAVLIAWFDGGLYVLQENPYPEIVFLRPSDHVLR